MSTPIAPAAPDLPPDLPVSRDVDPLDGVDEVKLDGVDLSGAQLRRLAIRDVAMDRCNLANLNAHGGTMSRVSATGVLMTGMAWSEAALRDVVMRDCGMTLASFAASKLEQVVFEDCVLTEASFEDTTMRAVRFERCDLRGATFTGARLQACELVGCRLDGIAGAAGLGGAAMPLEDILAASVTFASALGVRVLET